MLAVAGVQGADEVLSLQRPPGSNRLSGRFLLPGGEATLMLDTGAGVSALKDKSVRSLGLSPEEGLKFETGSLHGKVLGTQGARLNVRSGNWVLTERTPFVFLPPQTGTQTGDGLLGLGAMRTGRVILDVGKRQLHQPGWKLAGGNWISVPMAFADGRQQALVSCQAAGEKLTWILDTGSTSTILSAAAMERLGLKRWKTQHRLVDGRGGSEPLYKARLPGAAWAGRVLEDSWEVDSAHLRALAGTGADGLLGMDFLTKHAAVLDFEAGLLHLAPGS